MRYSWLFFLTRTRALSTSSEVGSMASYHPAFWCSKEGPWQIRNKHSFSCPQMPLGSAEQAGIWER